MAKPRTRPPTAEIREFAEGIEPVSKLDPYVKALFYGINGSGKTRLAASAPKALIIDINERGTRSAASSNARKREIGSWEQVGLAYWYLKEAKHPYKTIIIDTITGMHNVAMDFVLEEAEDRDPTLEKSKPTLPLYGRANTLMRGMLLAFRNLDMHVVFLAQEKPVKDKDTEEVLEISAALPDGARAAACDCVGIIGRTYAQQTRVRTEGKTQRVWVDHLLVGKHAMYKTKDRTNNLGNIVRNPNMPDIIRAWNRSRASGSVS